MSNGDIRAFVKSKGSWIEKTRAKVKKDMSEPPFSGDELRIMANDLRPVLSEKVRYFASVMNVRYGRITIRAQKTRYGSCSSKGNLNFNCILSLMPDRIVDYVVIHELCHLKHMDHSKEFWAEVEKYCSDYKDRRKWLKENGGKLISRIN